MNILVTGPRGGELPTGLVAMATLAVRDYAQQLGISRLKTNIHLRLHNALTIDDAEGLCEAVDNRNFIVDVCMFTNWLGILAHEMVHVKQYALNELDEYMTRWKSRTNVCELDYYDQPWEKEAFRLQDKLMLEFINR
jgi:hypothetical protein